MILQVFIALRFHELKDHVYQQGPVSDREYMQTLPKWSEYLQQAQQFIDENKSDELMPTQCPLSPISAYRCVNGDMGITDFKITYYPDITRLWHAVPMMTCFPAIWQTKS
jgi:hypothetical protein